MTDNLKEHTTAMVGENTTDLLALDTAKVMGKSSPCDIVNPLTKKPTGARVWLYGSDSQRVQDYVNGEADAQLAKNAELAARGKSPDAPTTDKARKRSIDLLIVATDKWENVNMGGQVVEFTHQRAQELYGVKFIREQLQEFMGEIENFTKG